MRSDARLLNRSAWLLSGSVVFLAVAAWYETSGLRAGSISLYRIFPLLGLVAFSLMWVHYVMSALRQKLNIDSDALNKYFETTSFLVLLAILLHPGLLIYQLGKDGFGYTPVSIYQSYVSEGLWWAVALGSTAILIFLAYELRRWYSTRSWWKLVSYGSDIGMVMIYIHALTLGRHLQNGWYRNVWWLYGVGFIISLSYIYYRRFKPVS